MVVDLGTGTGTLARGFARRGCRVIGIDPDPRMIDQARKLDAQTSVSVRYFEATAEHSGLDDHQADVVTAGQCWHWFDRGRALTEVHRILKPAGRLVIAHFDWLPLAGNLVEATEKLIERYNPQWVWGGGTGIHARWLPRLSDAGMRHIETFSYDTNVSYAAEAWRGRVRASAGITALDPDSVRDFDTELAYMLESEFPSTALLIPHRVFAIVAQAPAQSSG